MNPSVGSMLNAYAPPFERTCDQRCLFLTFSNGFPLTESQIFHFFDWMFPSMVEEVFVHRPRERGRVAKPGLFGKVMFKSVYIPQTVLGPFEKVCFIVEGRPMYCRRFVSQRPRTANAAVPRESRQ